MSTNRTKLRGMECKPVEMFGKRFVPKLSDSFCEGCVAHGSTMMMCDALMLPDADGNETQFCADCIFAEEGA